MTEMYIIFLFILLTWIILNGFTLKSIKNSSIKEEPFISVLIPVRNEERNIKDLSESLMQLKYGNAEFIFLNDGSEDKTGEMLAKLTKKDTRFRVIEGKELPEGWVGKVHACHQLAENSKGDFLFFIDADVRLHPKTVQRTLNAFNARTGLITGFPHYPVKSVLGHLLVPMQHFVVYLHLPVIIANRTKWTKSTAAHGAFMVFRKEAYEESGGHEAVKNSLVEDVHIARKVKDAGWYVNLVNNTASVSCYMYETSKEVWNGFAKNMFPGLGRNPFAALAVILFYWIFYVFPLWLVAEALLESNYLLLLPLTAVMLMKFTVDMFTRQKWWLFLVTPLSAFLMTVLLIYSMYLGLTRSGFAWKGRTYQ